MLQGDSLDTANASSSLLKNFTSISNLGSDWSLNNDWMCTKWAPPGFLSSKACTKEFLLPQVDKWTLQVDWDRSIWPKVDSCIPLGEVHPMGDKCALRESSTILAIVTGLNLVKCICIAYTARLHNRFSRTKKSQDHETLYLVTIGDAIASFLEHEDHRTKNMNLASKKEFENTWPDAQTSGKFENPIPTCWFWAASKSRWGVTMAG